MRRIACLTRMMQMQITMETGNLNPFEELSGRYLVIEEITKTVHLVPIGSAPVPPGEVPTPVIPSAENPTQQTTTTPHNTSNHSRIRNGGLRYLPKIRCFRCGNFGHKKRSCPYKVAPTKCFRCNRWGHSKRHCPAQLFPYPSHLKAKKATSSPAE